MKLKNTCKFLLLLPIAIVFKSIAQEQNPPRNYDDIVEKLKNFEKMISNKTSYELPADWPNNITLTQQVAESEALAEKYHAAAASNEVLKSSLYFFQEEKNLPSSITLAEKTKVM